MLKVGLTGGICSGKTTVSEIFARLGVPIIDMDVIARQVVEPGSPALAEITETFGPDVLNPDGSLNRQRLRQRIFDSDADRKKLEAILHPRIRAETERRVAELDASYCIIVIPLLAETGQQSLVDRILVVDVPESLQIERLVARDHISIAEAQKILNSQASREDRLHIADDVIHNEGDLASLEEQVRQLHARYIRLAENPS